MSKNINKKRKTFSFIACLCLTILLSASYSFAQEQAKFVTINYNDKEYLVVSDLIYLDIKENFYNKELLNKIEKSGYKIISAYEKYKHVLLQTDGKLHVL
jgi:hypothetical protein